MRIIFKIIKIGLFVLFIPLGFASVMLIYEGLKGYNVLHKVTEYKIGLFTVDYTEETGGGKATDRTTNYCGSINGQKIAVWKRDIRTFTRQKQLHIGDTLYVWYRDDHAFTLPRNKEEVEFKVSTYLFADFGIFIVSVIPPYLILLILYFILQKKIRNDENN